VVLPATAEAEPFSASAHAFCVGSLLSMGKKRVFVERLKSRREPAERPEAAHRITDIAFSCGFNDSSNFGRVFAALKSMTPTEWRWRGKYPRDHSRIQAR
jgi:AraC-like DNA-binding protein